MRKLFGATMALCLLAATAACNDKDATAATAALKSTIGAAAQASPKVASAVATVDSKIAAASAKLATYCLVGRTGLGGASLFASSTGAVAALRIAVSDFCDNPPSDPVSAVTLLQAAVSDMQAQGITTKSVVHLSLAQGRYAARRLTKLHLQYGHLRGRRGPSAPRA